MRVVTTHTLVWIDAHEAVIVGHRAGALAVEHLTSDVAGRHRATGHVRHDPSSRHGGGGGAPLPDGDSQRLEHLARFRRLVADRLPVADDLIVLGPGSVREHLTHELVEADERHHRTRTVVSAPAERMTDRQLVSRLAREAGLEPRRRTVGAYRWSGTAISTAAGRPVGTACRGSRETSRSC